MWNRENGKGEEGAGWAGVEPSTSDSPTVCAATAGRPSHPPGRRAYAGAPSSTLAGRKKAARTGPGYHVTWPCSARGTVTVHRWSTYVRSACTHSSACQEGGRGGGMGCNGGGGRGTDALPSHARPCTPSSHPPKSPASLSLSPVGPAAPGSQPPCSPAQPSDRALRKRRCAAAGCPPSSPPGRRLHWTQGAGAGAGSSPCLAFV